MTPVKAEESYQRSLTLAEKHRGANHALLVPSLRGLATLAANNGQLSDAEALYRRALKIQEADADEEADIARTLAELGLLCQLQGQTDDAESFYRRALDTSDASQLEDAEIAVIAGNLGALYEDQERYEEAESRFRRAVEIRARIQGSDHPDLAGLYERLGGLQYRVRRFEDAAGSYERGLRIREKNGREDVTVAEVLGHLAASYHQLGRAAAAEAHLGMAAAIIEAQCGDRERAGPCREALWNHRRLGEVLRAPPIEPAAKPEPAPEPAPRPETSMAVGSAPPPEDAEPATPPPAVAAVEQAPPAASEARVSPRPPVEEPPPPPSDARPARTHRAQVGARENPREAEEILERLRAALPRLLENLPARIVSADLGDRGVWHRIQIGEYERVAGAKALCAEIVRSGHEGCWVITTED